MRFVLYLGREDSGNWTFLSMRLGYRNLAFLKLLPRKCNCYQHHSPSQILSAHSFVYRGSSANTLSVIMSHICPPICFLFHIPQNHVLNGGRQAWNLPGNICLQSQWQTSRIVLNMSRPTKLCMNGSTNSLQSLTQKTFRTVQNGAK